MSFAGVEFQPDVIFGWSNPSGISFVVNDAGERDAGNVVIFDPRLHDWPLMEDFVGRIARFTDLVSQQPDASIQQSIDESGVVRNLPRRRGPIGPDRQSSTDSEAPDTVE